MDRDTALVRKIRQGNRVAFEKLYERYHRQLFSMGKKYLKDHELAEDAVQDIFVKLWKKRKELDPDRSVKSFLFTILKNHLLNMIRDRKKEIISVSRVQSRDLPHRNSTEEDVLYSDYDRIVRRGMDELSEGKRRVFEMRVYQGLTNSEIASMLLVSIHTVKTQYYHSSKFIKTYLKQHSNHR